MLSYQPRGKMLLRISALYLIVPFTALTTQQVHPAGIPVDLSVPFVPPAVDAEGERHLLYELHVTNFGSAELTLTEPKARRRREMPVENAAVSSPIANRVQLLPKESARSLAIVHVTIVDVRDGTKIPDQTVVIRGSRIEQVGNSRDLHVPEGAEVVDGKNKYLIPGLWDMHTHVWNDSTFSTYAIPLLVVAGITGFRDMAGRLEYVIPGRDALRAQTVLGPRAVVSGPVIDGAPPATSGDITVKNPQEARRAVDSLARAGVDFIKVYEMLRRDQFIAIADEARKRNLTFAGHLPLAVDAAEASDLGMTSFEHLRNLEFACSSKRDSLALVRVQVLDSSTSLPGRSVRARIHSAQRPTAIATEDRARCDALMAKLARNRTWQTPTLFLDEIALVVSDTAAMRRVRDSEKYLPIELSSWWHEQVKGLAAAPASAMKQARDYANWLRALIPRLRNAGVGILAGSDMPNLLTAPGFSLHEELRALRDAGLSNLEALQAATLNPARFLGATDSLGTVLPGKLADLVLLAADPMLDVGNTEHIDAVVLNGRLLRRTDLDMLLNAAKEAAEKRP
jgi:imidazolonepropionase-like amidohydrolase